jgi:glycosyltransferase involved in cell wall biosynthesis
MLADTHATPTFTVFTATHNRAHTLGRTYESLKAQTFHDFEWVIVDDGSSDDTSVLVRQWQCYNLFAIRYFRQSHSGKHVAFNRGVAEARGALFLTLDSDDACLPAALERLHHHWEQIPPSRRPEFSGVSCLCSSDSGTTVGDRFPSDVFDSDVISVAFVHRIKGDKWNLYRTDVLREFPFPVFPGERFVTEGLVWNRIARHYMMRFVNEALLVVEYRADGLSASSLPIRIASPKATLLYYDEFLSLPSIHWSQRIRAAANIWRFALHSQHVRSLWACLCRYPFVMAIGMPIGMGVAVKDGLRVRIR